MTLILTNDEVRRLLTMEACLEILEDAYREQAEGRAMSQLRHDTEMPVPEMPNEGRYEFKDFRFRVSAAVVDRKSTIQYRNAFHIVEDRAQTLLWQKRGDDGSLFRFFEFLWKLVCLRGSAKGSGTRGQASAN